MDRMSDLAQLPSTTQSTIKRLPLVRPDRHVSRRLYEWHSPTQTERRMLDRLENPQIPDLSRYKSIVNRLAERKLSGTVLDAESVESMSSALCMSGIDSLERALELELDFIPPGVFFHTWYPLHKTTLFDGKNNTKELNYIDQTIEEAELLERHNLPLLLIHSTHTLGVDEAEYMKDLFQDQKNILNLHIEEDFRGEYPDQKLSKMAHGVKRMESLRFCVLLDAENVLGIAVEKANRTGKKDLAARILKLSGQSITYLDFASSLLRPYLYELATPSILFRVTPDLYYDINASNTFFAEAWEQLVMANAISPDSEGWEVMSMKSVMRRHLNAGNWEVGVGRPELIQRNDRLHTALLDGEILRSDKDIVWTPSISYLRRGMSLTKDLPFDKLKDNKDLLIAVQNACSGSITGQKLRKRQESLLIILSGMQHLKMFYGGSAMSWC